MKDKQKKIMESVLDELDGVLAGAALRRAPSKKKPSVAVTVCSGDPEDTDEDELGDRLSALAAAKKKTGD